MALSETKCPNCGANIVADSHKKTISCIFCHTEFTLTPDETSSASTSVSADAAEPDLLERAEVFLSSLHKTDEALRLFSEYSMKYPSDYRGWLGIARALSDDFTKTDCDRTTIAKIEESVTSAIRVAEDEAPAIQKRWDEYRNTIATQETSAPAKAFDYLKRMATPVLKNSKDSKNAHEIQNLAERSSQLEREIAATEAQLQAKRHAYKAPTKGQQILWGCLTMFGVGLIFFFLDYSKKSAIKKLEKQLAQLETKKEKIDQRYQKLIAE